MAEYVTLIGAEDVSRAGSRMLDAAAEMHRAAATIDTALERHRQFMDDWLSRLDGTLQDRTHDFFQRLP